MAPTMITVTRGGAPILYFDDGGTTTTNAIALREGSVWVPAQQFVPTASDAASTFLALEVTSK